MIIIVNVMLYCISISCGLRDWFNIITGNILRSINDIPFVKPAISLHREDRYTGVLLHTFYYNFCWANEYWSFYREYRFTEDR